MIQIKRSHQRGTPMNHKEQQDDIEFYVSLLKKFDENGQFFLPTMASTEHSFEDWAEVTRPYLALILRGYARYKAGVSSSDYLHLETTEKGRQLLLQVVG